MRVVRVRGVDRNGNEYFVVVTQKDADDPVVMVLHGKTGMQYALSTISSSPAEFLFALKDNARSPAKIVQIVQLLTRLRDVELYSPQEKAQAKPLKRYAVFYLLAGPYGVVPEPLEVFLCQAESAEHAIEQFEDVEPTAKLQFVTVEV